MSRTIDRADFDPPVRIRLLERDMDDHDEVIDRLTQALEAARKEFRDQLDGIRKVLLSMVIALGTSAVLLGLNLTIGALGGN